MGNLSVALNGSEIMLLQALKSLFYFKIVQENVWIFMTNLSKIKSQHL